MSIRIPAAALARCKKHWSAATMSEQKSSDQPKLPQTPGLQDSAKKPYLKPAFRHEQVFETMALACGKINPSQGQCRVNRKKS